MHSLYLSITKNNHKNLINFNRTQCIDDIKYIVRIIATTRLCRRVHSSGMRSSKSLIHCWEPAVEVSLYLRS